MKEVDSSIFKFGFEISVKFYTIHHSEAKLSVAYSQTDKNVREIVQLFFCWPISAHYLFLWMELRHIWSYGLLRRRVARFFDRFFCSVNFLFRIGELSVLVVKYVELHADFESVDRNANKQLLHRQKNDFMPSTNIGTESLSRTCPT